MGRREPAVYRFDRFVLDLVRGALLADGAECALQPKSFALLRHLVENAQRLIGRDEIMETVWPGVVGTEDSIAQCVKEIRRALGEDEQRLLRTLPRRGYLFAAQVSRTGAVWQSRSIPSTPPGLRAELGRALLLAGRPEEALPELRWCAARLPDYGPCRQALVVAAAETGRMEEARAAVQEVLRLTPDRTTRNIDAMWIFRDPTVTERFRTAFRVAGLPA